ncbi:MAG TPA: PASTA domain-containing protein [Solirubrobacterales bacterium]|nr:PASTA domain-containing protein [Solirubrobacterales bacterium]
MAGGGKRLWLICALGLISASACSVPAISSANLLPLYDGALTFPNIEGPQGPEEFAWRVSLGEGQVLEQVDEAQAVVRYESGHLAFTIQAEPAHDAIGATVPTTLAVSEEDVITLTVHHRGGNPAAGDAPFDYPIIAGEGWEGGLRPPVIVQGPPDEQQLRESRERANQPTAEPSAAADLCVVPRLKGLALPGARGRLRAAGCRIGRLVHRRSRSAGPTRVWRQSPRPERAVPVGTPVILTLRG